MSREPPPLQSGMPRIAWPAMVNDRAAQLLALQYQFEATQWLPPAELRRRQFEQLTSLLRHAVANVPFHAERLAAAGIDAAAPLTEAAWSRLPVLTRQDVQRAGERLIAATLPPSHGRVSDLLTGGTTGQPVRVRRSELDAQIGHAMSIREELWHREDMLANIACIRPLSRQLTPEQRRRAQSETGLTLPDWGTPASLLWQTGRLTVLHPDLPVEVQARALCRLNPRYLLTFPATLRPLLACFREAQLILPMLRAVWTAGEVVDGALRALCREVFRVRIVDNYAAAEVGCIALQCPEHDVFHAQAEAVLVEVLDAAGRACAPGEIGRVVVTPLHSFAMPLLRYDIGDEAETGDICPCGRGLPVLTRVIGRARDYVVLPSGMRRRAAIAQDRLARIKPIRECQIVQRSPRQIELLLVVSRALTEGEEQAVRDLLGEAFPELDRGVTYRASLPRNSTGRLPPFLPHLDG